MLNLQGEYLQSIKPLIDDTIDNFLNLTASHYLKQLIYDKSFEVVYKYKASKRAMETRRYTIGDSDAMVTSVSGHELTIMDTAQTQGESRGLYEADIVQSGYSNYKQPEPRPFMEAALNEYIDKGYADDDLREALEEAGFEVRSI